jgi:hypothetical protein
MTTKKPVPHACAPIRKGLAGAEAPLGEPDPDAPEDIGNEAQLPFSDFCRHIALPSPIWCCGRGVGSTLFP